MRLKYVFAAIAALSWIAPVQAQASGCAPRDRVLDVLAQKAQTRRAIGLAGHAVMELFAATDSTDWAVTVTLPDGRMCLLAQGTAFDAGAEMFPAPANWVPVANG